jgi:hypothetical protein
VKKFVQLSPTLKKKVHENAFRLGDLIRAGVNFEEFIQMSDAAQIAVLAKAKDKH